MTILNQINDVRSYLKDKLNFLSEESIDSCINTIEHCCISNVIDKEYLNSEDIKLLVELSKDCYNIVKSNDLSSTISKMKNIVRENTNGACGLDRVYISELDFKVIKEIYSLDYTKTIKIFGVEILPNTELITLAKCSVFGVCWSKFNSASARNLVILGS